MISRSNRIRLHPFIYYRNKIFSNSISEISRITLSHVRRRPINLAVDLHFYPFFPFFSFTFDYIKYRPPFSITFYFINQRNVGMVRSLQMVLSFYTRRDQKNEVPKNLGDKLWKKKLIHWSIFKSVAE